MSSLTDVERLYLESILSMGGGYVLDYTDDTFGVLFQTHEIDIHSKKFQTYGTSKAKKLRSFWMLESDNIVAEVLKEMIDRYEASCAISGNSVDSSLLQESRQVVSRLSGDSQPDEGFGREYFLSKEFSIPNVQLLPIEAQVAEIIESRLSEAQVTLSAGAHLSVIILCGSVLEAVLLGAAQQNPAKFNRSAISPKQDGKVKPFYQWTLAEFINVACSIELLKPDVQKFCHGLRDFRNYIHPYQQLSTSFTPDEHTAKVCFQVLKAALADLSGERE